MSESAEDRALCAIADYLAGGPITDQPDENYWLEQARPYVYAVKSAGVRLVTEAVL